LVIEAGLNRLSGFDDASVCPVVASISIQLGAAIFGAVGHDWPYPGEAARLRMIERRLARSGMSRELIVFSLVDSAGCSLLEMAAGREKNAQLLA
jgi:hypothetical protein